MKVKITFDEKEEICVKIFAIINNLKQKCSMLEKELNQEYINKDKIKKNYDLLKIEYNKILDTQIGKGEYYKILTKPIDIQERLTILEDSIYDSYTGRVDRKKEQEYHLLRNILKEDLKIAKEQLEEFQKKAVEIENDYSNVSNAYEQCNNKILSLKTQIKKLKNLQKKALLQIKYLNTAYTNDKKVNVKKLSLSSYHLD